MIREKTARGLWKSYRVVESSAAENLAAGTSAKNVSTLEVKTVVASVLEISDDIGSQDGSESEYITLLIPEDLESQMLWEHGGEMTESQGHGAVVSKHHPTSTDLTVADELCKSQVTENGVSVNIVEQRATFTKKGTEETGSKAPTNHGYERIDSSQMNSTSEVSLRQQNESSNMHAFGAAPQANTTIGGGNNDVQTCSTKGEHATDTLAGLTHESDRGQSAWGQTPAAEIGTNRGHGTVTDVQKNDSRSVPFSVADSMCEGHTSETGLSGNIDKPNDTFTENGKGETDNNNALQEGVNSDQAFFTPEGSFPRVEPPSSQVSDLTPQANVQTVTTVGGEKGVQTMCSADSSGPILNTPVPSVTIDAAPDMGQSAVAAPADRSGTTGGSMPLGLQSPVAGIGYCSSLQTAGSNHRPITSTIRKKLSPSRRRNRLPSIPEEARDTPDSDIKDVEANNHSELADVTAGKETAELEDMTARREDDTRCTATKTTTEKKHSGVVEISSALRKDMNSNGHCDLSDNIAEDLDVHVQDTTDSPKTDQMIMPEATSPSSTPSTTKDNPGCVDGMESRGNVEHADNKTMTTEKAPDKTEAISPDTSKCLHYNGLGATDTVNVDQAVLSEGESLGLAPSLSTGKVNSEHVQTTFTQQHKTMCQPEAGNTLLKEVAEVNLLCNGTEGSPGHGTNTSEAKPYVKSDKGDPDHVDATLGGKNELLEEKLSDPDEIQDDVTFAEVKTEDSPGHSSNTSEAKPYVKSDLPAGDPGSADTTLSSKKDEGLEAKLSDENEEQDYVTFAEGKTEATSVKSASGKILTNNHLILPHPEFLNTLSKEELIAKIAELTQENATLKAIQQAPSNLKANGSVIDERVENLGESNAKTKEPYMSTPEHDSVAVRVKLKEMTRDVSELLQEQAELNEEVDNLRQCQEKVDFLILENKSLLFDENGWYADEEDTESEADTDLEDDSVLLSLREELASAQQQLKEKDRRLREAEETVAQLTEELDRLKVDRKAAKKPKSKAEKRRRSTTSLEVSVLESHMDFSTKVQSILGEGNT
ncbi:hypothetical protein Bbelb_237010 [Branchiostoma belcheri]|nr:hypothetical protein Bbelb_237010 [Branchiostoma belcheri]